MRGNFRKFEKKMKGGVYWKAKAWENTRQKTIVG
jgi:hypothetical protein